MGARPGSGTRLGPWWPCAALGAVGLVVLVGTGHIVWGAGLIALAFVMAAAFRLAQPAERGGGLHVRSRALDVVLCLTAAINMLGAALMVGPHLSWQVLGAVDLVLLVVIAVVFIIDGRAARDAWRAQLPQS
ncbi:DUF3017 domain-containing protein [Piscicoccus intestinalis]|uniref:DUF3017 domain-containing protein n=1 Tax=Piscicoccus intestinalis TaxID=746033 RepID=UPI00083958DA|nr:DUF3017 domain-containing protein [Piscicoccus intestinalis]